jgi:hypothetical protein
VLFYLKGQYFEEPSKDHHKENCTLIKNPLRNLFRGLILASNIGRDGRI